MFVCDRTSFARQIINILISPGGNGSLIMGVDAVFRQSFGESSYAAWLRALIVLDAVGTGLIRYTFGHILSVALVAQSLQLHSLAHAKPKGTSPKELPLSRRVLFTVRQICSSNGILAILGGLDMAFFYFVQQALAKVMFLDMMPRVCAELMAAVITAPFRLAWTKATLADKSKSFWAKSFSVEYYLNWYCIRRLAWPTITIHTTEIFAASLLNTLSGAAQLMDDTAAIKYNLSPAGVRIRVLLLELLMVLLTIVLRLGIMVPLSFALTVLEISMMPPEMKTILHSPGSGIVTDLGKPYSMLSADVTPTRDGRTTKVPDTFKPEEETVSMDDAFPETEMPVSSNDVHNITTKGDEVLTISQILQSHQLPMTFWKAWKQIRLPLCIWLLELHIKACLVQIAFESLTSSVVWTISAFLSARSRLSKHPYYEA